MEDPIFADGMMWRDPHNNAPDFVKGNISINPKKFYEWAKKHENAKGWVSLDMKESKKGQIYFQLNTFKPKKPEYPQEDINPDDIPF